MTRWQDEHDPLCPSFRAKDWQAWFAVRWCQCDAIHAGKAAVLADLRAKVEALRGKWQRSVDRDPDGKLSGYDRAHAAALGAVLDLIDGADL